MSVTDPGLPQESLLDAARAYVGFTAEDLACLRRFSEVFRPHLAAMSDDFYDALLAHPEVVQAFFSDPARIIHLKRTLSGWAEELLTAYRDDAYLAKRLRIGEVHVAIGVEPRFILGAMGRVRRFMAARAREAFARAEAEATIASLSRATDLDLVLMTESYNRSTRLRDLEEANARLRRVLDQAPLAVFGYDREGRILDWNPAAERLFGFTREEAVGRSAFDLFLLEEDHGFVRGLIARVFAGEAMEAMERRHRAKDGRILRTILAHAPIRRPEGIHEAFAFCLDQTEVLALREQILEREKMAALGTLAAGVAHEVGNPLSSISAICQLIERKGDDGRLAERIRTIRESVGRIDGIVRRVLDFARRDEGISVIEIPRIVHEVRELLDLDHRLAGIGIDEEFPEDLPLVRVPRTGFIQVLINLLLNAADAVETRGAEAKIRIQAERRGEDVLLAVEDNGAGFTPEALRRGVEPFFSTKEQGTGLGLAISYGILERAGGRLALSNRTDEPAGGRVEVWLPRAGTN